MTKLTAVIANPGEDARVIEMEGDSYKALVKLIGGLLCSCPFPSTYKGESLAAWCHDEALIEGLPWNRKVGPETPIAGPIVVTGLDVEGETIGLSERAAKACVALLNKIPRLDHEKASSIEEYEEMVGHPAIQIIPLE